VGAAMAEGLRSLPAFCQRTGAGQACESCRPLLAQLLGAPNRGAPESAARSLAVIAVLAMLVIGALLAWPPPQPQKSVRAAQALAVIWRDHLWRQVSGFAVLGLTALTLGLPLRKRWFRLGVGAVAGWRLWHAALGATALLGIGLHTGFRLGRNFNLGAMSGFLGVALTGALLGWLASTPTPSATRKRRFWLLVHIFLVWLLPALITAHIVSVYYF